MRKNKLRAKEWEPNDANYERRLQLTSQLNERWDISGTVNPMGFNVAESEADDRAQDPLRIARRAKTTSVTAFKISVTMSNATLGLEHSKSYTP